MLTYENWATSPSSVYLDEIPFELRSEELKAAYAYWLDCAKGTIPQKKSLVPRSMKAFLGNVAIFEKKSDGLYLVRLMGTHLTNVIGEMQGRTITDALPLDAAQRWSQAFDNVIATQRPSHIISHLDIGLHKYLEADIFLAPLLDEDGRTSMILGVATIIIGKRLIEANRIRSDHA
jgi:hypothetical protein